MSSPRFIDRAARSYVRLALGRPLLVLAVLLAITLAALWRGTQIVLDTDLKSLLPEDAHSVVAIEEARQRRVGSDLFVIAVESPEPLATVQFIDALNARLSAWEEVEYIEITQDREFFRDHALLFLPVEELQRMHDNLRRMVRREQGERNPLFVDLEREDETGEFDWRDPDNWVSDWALAEMGLGPDEVEALFPFVERDDDGSGEGSGAGAPTPEQLDAERIRQARNDLPEQYRDYRMSPNGRVGVFTAQLRGRSTDIATARRVYEHADAVIRELNPASFHPEMRASVVGAWKAFLEVQAVGRDSSRATMISLVLVLGLVVAFFRNLRSMFIVMLPLLAGIAWTLGLIELVFGHLNTLTAFVFSMLIGMGIDFGIHIFSRALEEFHAGASWEDALHSALTKTGRALVSATATTIAALLALLLASFDGFREFGVACAAGVALCLVAAVVVIPPLVGAFERLSPLKRRPASAATATRTAPWVLSVVRVGAVVTGVVVALGAATLNRVAFEYDFSNLEAPKTGSGIAYGAALGRNRSSAPSVLLGQSEAQMRAAHMVLRERFRNHDRLLRGYITIETLVPADQAARMEVIDAIFETLDKRAFRNLEGDEGEFVDAIRDLTETEPFTIEALPDWARRQLTERDGSIGAMGLLYGDFNDDDAREVAAFQAAYATIETTEGDVRVSSNGFIISDVVTYVQADAAHLALYVGVALFVILLLDFRRLGPAVVCMATLGSGVLVTTLFMVVFDIKLGLYNIIVLPTILGTGIDAAIHIYHRYLEEGPGSVERVMRTTGVSVAASAITTGAGFFGLLLVQHKGVISIGALACSGMVGAVATALALLPAWLLLRDRGAGSGR